MKTRTTLAAFVCILVFLMSAFSANALKEDFTATADAEVTAYQCSQSTVPIQILNTGSVGSSYEITLSGEAAKWAKLSQSSIILYPGDSKLVYLYFGVPCNAEEDVYSLDVSIKTILGLEKYLSLEVNVAKPQNLNLIPVVTARALDPCTPANYHLQIQNKGSFVEEYSLSILSKDFEGRITLSENPVVIEPGKTKDVFVYVTPFACNVYGDYAIHGKVAAKNSGLSEEFYLDLTVNPTGIPAIAEGISTIKSNYTAIEQEIVIRNLGQSAALYTVYIEGPQWLRISPTSINVAPEGQGIVKLGIAPAEDIAEGKYTATIVAKVASTGVEYAKDITIKLKHPTFFGMLVSKYLWAIILGAIVLAVLVIVFIMLLRYLDRTKEIRAEHRIQRQKEREERRIEKDRIKAERRAEKERQKEIKRKEWEERKAALLAVREEKRKLREQRGKEKKKLKEQRKAEKLRLKKEKIAAREKLRKEKEKEKLRLAAEKEKDRMLREAEKETRKEERRQEAIRSIALRHIKSEYILKPKSDKKSPWLAWLIGITIFILIIAGLAYTFRQIVWNFLTEFWMYVLIGVAAVIIIIVVISLITRPSSRLGTRKEISEAKKEVKSALEESYTLISRAELRRQAAANKAKAKEARKKAAKNMPNIARWWVPAVIIIAVLAAVIYIFLDFIIANIIYLAAAIAAIIVLIILIMLLSRIGSKKQKWKLLKANKSEIISLKWSKGLYEIFLKAKRELADVVLLVKKNSRSKAFFAPADKVYQYFEVKRRNIENSDIEKVTFRFKISKSWLKKIKDGTVRLLRYNNERWTGCQTEVISEDNKFVYYQAIASGFSQFAIAGKQLLKPKEAAKAKEAGKDELKVMEAKIVKEQKKADKKLKAKEKKEKKRKPMSLWWLGYLIIALIIIGGICVASYFVISNLADRSADGSAIEDEVEQLDIQIEEMEEGADIIDAEELDIEEAGVIPSESDEEGQILDDIEETDDTVSGMEDVIEDADEEGIPAQVWDEDAVHTLDLNGYFSDPDNDTLTFSCTPLENIIVEINSGIATFTPQPGWSGEEEVVFTAEDSEGDSVDSNAVKLVVNDAAEATSLAKAKEMFMSYLKYIIVGVIVLVLLIILLEYRKPILKFLEEE